MARSKRFFGNWKMNGSFSQADEFFSSFFELAAGSDLSGTDYIGITPTACYLDYVGSKITSGGIDTLKLGAQDGSKTGESMGAFTGQIGMPMYADCGASYVIIGQSETREYLGITDEDCNYRILRALSVGLKVIYCVGENLEQREAGEGPTVVLQQINEGLSGLTTEQLINSVMIVYEPVWAIGTGKTCSADDAQEMCALIRTAFGESFNQEVSENIYISYGGSSKPSNALELCRKPDIDGLLIGGASLKPDQFLGIIVNGTGKG